jgi:hypothetical protein
MKEQPSTSTRIVEENTAEGFKHPRESEITARLAVLLERRFSPAWTVQIDGKLSYSLPGGTSISHKNDILLSTNGRHVSVEVKFRSAVTDQFKARSFDAFHLKREYAERILVVMVFVRAERGLSLAGAKSICHWFDVFFGYKFSEMQSEWELRDLIDTIDEFGRRAQPDGKPNSTWGRQSSDLRHSYPRAVARSYPFSRGAIHSNP